MLVNAQIILVKCKSTKKLFGARIEEQQDKSWIMNWAFPIKENIAQNEGFDKNKLSADIYIDNAYPGCPDCGAKNIVRCSGCGKLSCFNNEPSFNCAWCSRQITAVSFDSPIELNAGDF